MELDLLNASSQSLLRVSAGNLPETCDMGNIRNRCLLMGYQISHMTRRRTGVKRTKAHPTIHTPTNFANWGLPKPECLKRLCVMPLGDKSQGFAKRDDAEYPAR